AFEADQDVLDRVVERVPHVKAAGDIGWRDDDAERLGTGGKPVGLAAPERSRLFPLAVEPRFDFSRLVGLFEHDGPSVAAKTAPVAIAGFGGVNPTNADESTERMDGRDGWPG